MDKIGMIPYIVFIDSEHKIFDKCLVGSDLRKVISDLTKKNRK